MRVLRVEAKDVYVTIELSLQDLRDMSTVIDMSEFNYDSTKPEDARVYEFLNEKLYPFINGTIKGVEDGA